MCASYGAGESTLVSTRSTVPETLASAAALTLAATSPVSACSVLPLTVCRPCGAAVCDEAVAEFEGVVVEGAAFAIAPPPIAAAQTAAAVTRLVRMRDMGCSLG